MKKTYCSLIGTIICLLTIQPKVECHVCTSQGNQMLTTDKTCFMDGTFRRCRSQFAQTYATLYIWILEMHLTEEEQYQQFLYRYQAKLKKSIVLFSELHNIVFQNQTEFFCFYKLNLTCQTGDQPTDNGIQKCWPSEKYFSAFR